MPREYTPSTTKGQWTQDDLTTALKSIEDGMSVAEASKTYKIGRATLDRYRSKGITEKIYKLNVHTVFTKAEENLLEDYVVQSCRMYYGLTLADLRVLAFEFAVANRKAIPDNWTRDKMALNRFPRLQARSNNKLKQMK